MKTFENFNKDNFNKEIFDLIKYNKTDWLETYIKGGEDINIQDINGRSMLMVSIDYTKHRLSKLLIEYGIDMNIQDNYGYTAGMYAASSNRLNDMIMCLETPDIDVDLINQNGQTMFDLIYYKQDRDYILEHYPEKFQNEIKKIKTNEFNL